MPTLFGGALELALPDRFEDISCYRDVPDNQEVFTDAESDQSVIVEILELAAVSDEESAPFLFQDLAEAGSATSSTIEGTRRLENSDIPLLPENTTAYSALGIQRVAKGRDDPQAANELQVILAVVRLKTVSSDVVITLNTPITIDPCSSSAQAVSKDYKRWHDRAPEDFNAMLQSFAVLDWGLFGPCEPAPAAESA